MLPLFLLLIQQAMLSPFLISTPLPLESSPGFPAASLPFLTDWASPRPAAPAVTAAGSAPRQPRALCHPGLGLPSPAAPVWISLLPDRGTSAAAEEEAAAGPLPSAASPARSWRGGNSWQPPGGQCTQLSATPARSRPRPAHSRHPPPPPGRSPSSFGGDPPAAGEARAIAAPAPAAGEAAADEAGAAAPPAATPAPSGRTTTRASVSVSRWCLRLPLGSWVPWLRGALQPPTLRPPPSPPRPAPPPPPPRLPPPAA